MILLGLWYAWVLLSPIISDGEFSFSSPYLIAPLSVVIGFGVAIQPKKLWTNQTVLPMLIALVAVVISVQPIYANARGAVGVLMVGLAALILHDERTRTRGVPSSLTSHALPSNVRLRKRDHGASEASSHRGPDQASSHGTVQSPLNYRVLLGFLIGLTGLLMSRASQASFFLAVVLALASAVAIFWTAPPKWLCFLIAFLGVELAVIVVTYLGTRDSWPDWPSDGESLSSARHTLWSDAVSLWSTNPAVGAGMGTFTASSELASSRADLAATHSLFLQVGAELGIVGILLLTCLFGGVLYRCSPTARSAAFIGMMAWMCLGIHTSIDHLEDFPVVWLMAGAVLALCASEANRHPAPDQTQ